MNKRLVGGVFLLCLTAMALTLSEDGETYTNITQPEILEQLTNLKTFISNPKMIKPVWVQLKNDDEIVVVQGELKVVDTGEFEICVKLNGYKLIISVEFTQAELSDHTPIDDWYIDTNDAKYLFTSDTQALAQELADFTGDVAITGDAEITGDVDITGDIAVTGKVNGKIAFEDIEDADGHKRFIEGDIELEENTGLSLVYGKWSLSGTHLMIVIAGNIADDATHNQGVIAELNLPQWIKDKIYAVAGNNVEIKPLTLYASDLTTQTATTYLEKTGNVIDVYLSQITATADRNYRIAFDLLIDNEQSE